MVDGGEVGRLLWKKILMVHLHQKVHTRPPPPPQSENKCYVVLTVKGGGIWWVVVDDAV